MTIINILSVVVANSIVGYFLYENINMFILPKIFTTGIFLRNLFQPKESTFEIIANNFRNIS